MKISKKALQNNPLFIAEVGQNHQGSFKLACKYVEVFSKIGAVVVIAANANPVDHAENNPQTTPNPGINIGSAIVVL